MESEKSDKKLIILFIIIIVILSVLCVLFATGIIRFNFNDVESDKKNNDITDNVKIDDKEKIDESNFYRETRITLIDAYNCNGNSSPLIANIESNGNISITQNMGAVEIQTGNAKYLYNVSVLTCDNIRLYYITEDKELYVINRPNAVDYNQKGTRVSSSKIIEFLGTEHRDDGSYLKVLTENQTIEYIKYFTAPDYWSE